MKKALRIVFLFLFISGCASEGGVTGTGISAIVAGHVSAVGGGSEEGIEVSVAGAGALTDGDGNFELFGEFSGQIEVRFSEPGQTRPIGAVSISVPPGSTSVLEDVVIDRQAARLVDITVVRQGSVVGRIEDVACANPSSIAIRLEDRSTFSLLLSDEVVIRARGGSALGCAQLRRGDRVEATGVQLSNGVRVAFAIELTERAVEPVDRFAVEFGGSVNDIFCDQGRVVVLVLTEDDPFLASIRPRNDTRLICVDEGGPRKCECEDIQQRDILQIKGEVTVANPDAVVASSILVFPGPALVDLSVRALRIGCTVRKIEAEAVFETTRQLIVARFGNDTRFICDRRPCRCEDLRPDEELRLIGSPIVASGRPFIDVGVVQQPPP